MTIAETAELAVNLKLGTTGSFAGATTQLRQVEAAAAGATVRGVGLIESGLSKASTAASKFGGALDHAKHQIGGLLSGPLGVLGLSAGLFTVGGALEQGISKATEMGKAATRLSAITGLATETTSALSAAMEHFGIGVDKQLRSVGFLEKNVGLLASRKGAITDFEKTFSFALTDANGHLKDANELILQSADYFNNKSIPATTKAAALAKLYGRSWQDLVPLLAAGRAGIQAAEEEAAKFGLTLTKDNIGALVKLREATRTWGTALGGLEVQLGLLVVGPLTDLANFGTDFIAKNRDQIQTFFKNLIKTAQQFAAFVTGTVIPTLMGIGSAAKTAWGAVPAPIRDLLVKGFVADKAIKFLFGFSPITFAADALKGVAGAIGGALARSIGTSFAAAGIGKLFVQPVFVTNQIPGGGGLPVPPGEPVPVAPGQGFKGAIGNAAVTSAAVAVATDTFDNHLTALGKELLGTNTVKLDDPSTWGKMSGDAMAGALADHFQGSSPAANTIGDHFQRALSPLARSFTSTSTATRAAMRDVGSKIDAAKRAQVAAAHATTLATNAARDAIRRQKLKVDVTVVNTINSRGLSATASRDTRFYGYERNL